MCRRSNNLYLITAESVVRMYWAARCRTRRCRRQTLIAFERIDYFAVDGFASRLAAVFRRPSGECMASWSAWRHLLNGFESAILRRLQQINLRYRVNPLYHSTVTEHHYCSVSDVSF